MYRHLRGTSGVCTPHVQKEERGPFAFSELDLCCSVYTPEADARAGVYAYLLLPPPYALWRGLHFRV